ncbi:MAG: hypothetical protein K6D59_06880 [Bacteroidales bacterium]|nr:hypothetical protein [Bacteroidales bacterium]
MKKIFLALSVLCGIGLVSCSSEKTVLNDTDRTAIVQVIENHDNTLIYIWADYCEASKIMLEENIKPNLEGLEKNNVGIVIIHYGKEEAVAELKSANRMVVNVDLSTPFFIKRDANKAMLSLLKDYRKTNAMPIPLLVNRDGLVENYDEEDNHYGYAKIIFLSKTHQ